MTLHDVNEQSKFEEFYRVNNVNTISEKINYLKKSMKIRAILCDEEETPEEELAGLEESALQGFWKASWS